MAMAKGARNSAPAPKPSASGSSPSAVVTVVMQDRPHARPARRFGGRAQGHPPPGALVNEVDFDDRVVDDDADMEDAQASSRKSRLNSTSVVREEGWRPVYI